MCASRANRGYLSKGTIDSDGNINSSDLAILTLQWLQSDDTYTDDPGVMYPRLASLDGPVYQNAAFSLNEFGHQGLMHDETTGLIYNRARFRNHDRFLQRDPLSYIDGMNSYATFHVLAGLFDPMGLSSTPSIIDLAKEGMVFPGMNPPSPHGHPHIPRSKRNPMQKLAVFNGYEDSRYQKHDDLITELVSAFNANKEEWCGCWATQADGTNHPEGIPIPDLNPNLVKSWIIQETGGNGTRSREAWEKDPAQVNNPGDWGGDKNREYYSYKEDLGLKHPGGARDTGEGGQRNTGTLRGNLEAAIKYLCRKGYAPSGQPPSNRPQDEGYFDGWDVALFRYNGRGNHMTVNGKSYSDNYVERIMGRMNNPGTHYPIELPPTIK